MAERINGLIGNMEPEHGPWAGHKRTGRDFGYTCPFNPLAEEGDVLFVGVNWTYKQSKS